MSARLTPKSLVIRCSNDHLNAETASNPCRVEHLGGQAVMVTQPVDSDVADSRGAGHPPRGLQMRRTRVFDGGADRGQVQS
ncbi:hypothetical protein RHA1_ro09145 (plasmid) [Rhodococcus jostii RHA1]|uniref:Uncharacterized protein n=1 Tax=Rhodococcus jostii (strain RHA1) TaxID=101510 RepID=Q0RWZ8_RHOJR|nr:hypothetical protein RHA1_ro09145 [Rhodococcus jostii RHA1]